MFGFPFNFWEDFGQRKGGEPVPFCSSSEAPRKPARLVDIPQEVGLKNVQMILQKDQT